MAVITPIGIDIKYARIIVIKFIITVHLTASKIIDDTVLQSN